MGGRGRRPETRGCQGGGARGVRGVCERGARGRGEVRQTPGIRDGFLRFAPAARLALSLALQLFEAARSSRPRGLQISRSAVVFPREQLQQVHR